ncbi:MAG TPA: hydrogenase expression/formation protein HypE [Candidatus Krumholzibacteriaceae bacterium]|nr:hydrogenase expression/formation protein HypE [Candidatus Krumholzibacteriaceae bacterium]
MNRKIITSAHGGGGTATKEIIDIAREYLGNPALDQLGDSALLDLDGTGIAFTTDSYVIDPIFFPGGDIGKIAVCGTVNDIAMEGAKPLYMSLSLILEEGLEFELLERVIASVASAAREAGVLVVTGDTKVVEHGRAGGGLFINTAAVGRRYEGCDTSVSNAAPGDLVVVTGTIGDHGVTIINEREELELESGLKSDVAALNTLVEELLTSVPGIKSLRDPTRGGLAAALCDIAGASKAGIEIEEVKIKVKREVKAACDLLGFDPLNIANEGKAVIVCSEDSADEVLKICRDNEFGRESVLIGSVVSEHPETVVLRTTMGGKRIVDMPRGENLPRIC